ncbi:MAG TPA: hypothetical protein VHZ55_20350 [Bryobacteraceae bacterium]|jgi:hypothetical protein|nr:hypothetical protein [Bryobacteraceae bacterium]
MAVSNYAAPCQSCHAKQVLGYSHFSMSRSLRPAALEPTGSFRTATGTQFTIYTRDGRTWQRLEREGERFEYPVQYVIGSGNHAAGYLIQLGDHLFQSPLA